MLSNYFIPGVTTMELTAKNIGFLLWEEELSKIEGE